MATDVADVAVVGSKTLSIASKSLTNKLPFTERVVPVVMGPQLLLLLLLLLDAVAVVAVAADAESIGLMLFACTTFFCFYCHITCCCRAAVAAFVTAVVAAVRVLIALATFSVGIKITWHVISLLFVPFCPDHSLRVAPKRLNARNDPWTRHVAAVAVVVAALAATSLVVACCCYLLLSAR